MYITINNPFGAFVKMYTNLINTVHTHQSKTYLILFINFSSLVIIRYLKTFTNSKTSKNFLLHIITSIFFSALASYTFVNI